MDDLARVLPVDQDNLGYPAVVLPSSRAEQVARNSPTSPRRQRPRTPDGDRAQRQGRVGDPRHRSRRACPAPSIISGGSSTASRAVKCDELHHGAAHRFVAGQAGPAKHEERVGPTPWRRATSEARLPQCDGCGSSSRCSSFMVFYYKKLGHLCGHLARRRACCS